MKHLFIFSCMLVLLFLTTIQAFAQIEKIHKIDSTNDNYGGLYVTPKYTFFSGTQGDHGRIFWRTDGTEQGTIQLFNTPSGKLNVNSTSFKTCVYDSVQNKLYFLGYIKNSGWELWVTDGSESGTFLIKDLTPITTSDNKSQASTIIYLMWLENDNLFIIHIGSGSQNQKFPLLYSRPNIHTNVIETLSTLPSPTYNFNVTHHYLRKGNVIQTNTMLYYLDDNNRIIDSSVVNFNNNFRFFLADNSILYLSISDTSSKIQYIWSTDGVREQNTSLFPFIDDQNLIFHTTNEKIFFKTFKKPDTMCLCVFNMISKKTDTVYQRGKDNEGTSPLYNLGTIGKRIIFTLSTGQYGIEPWYWDIISNEIRILKDINPLFYNSSINDYYLKYFTHKDHLYFFADDAVHGNELWTTDGTEAGTKLVQDLNPEGGWITPVYISGTNEQLYFVGWNGKNDRSLYRYVYPKTLTTIDLQSNIHEVNPYVYFDNSQSTIIFNSALSDENITEVCLFDYLGNQIIATAISSSKSPLQIPIKQTLSSGIYFTRIKSHNKFITIPLYISTP